MDDFEEEDALWLHVTKDVSPIKRHKGLSDEKAAPKTPKKTKFERAEPVTEIAIVPDVSMKPQDLDRRSAERLRKGQMPIEATLDLHGMTQVEAFPALRDFVVSCALARKRCVLVITGKGGGEGGLRDPLSSGQGVLKRRLPEWIQDPALAPYILKLQAAKPQHGGGGAYYVLLRRNRG